MLLHISIVHEAKVLLGSFLIHPPFVHASLHGVIIREKISMSWIDHDLQASFGDMAIEQIEELVMCLTSLMRRVYEFMQRTATLLAEFMSIPLIHKKSLVPCFAYYNQILTLSFGITNWLTRSCLFWYPCCLHCSHIFIAYLIWQTRSWSRKELIGELPVDHVVHGCQSLQDLSVNLNLSSNLRIDYIFVAMSIQLYIGDKVL